MAMDSVKELADDLRFKGGAHINHSFFWESLAPIFQNGGVKPAVDSELMRAIEKGFGSFDSFKYDLSETTE